MAEFTKYLDKYKNTYVDLHFPSLQEIIGLSYSLLLSERMQLYCYTWLIRHILEII